MRIGFTFLLFALTLACPLHAARRRALLVGIDDYSASRLLAAPHAEPAPDRQWPTLAGSVNDVAILGEMLPLTYGFDRGDIVSLTDQHATREAILQRLDDLARDAAKDDVVLFYFAGHGSQVRNTRSDERDQLDESIVPADSRLGAPDLRDKELRLRFNRILDHGARLTVILDSCHSGSGARGLPTGAWPRGVRADVRDVGDGSDAGPRPEDRGALVLTASHDFDDAWESRDDKGMFHGAFSWALQLAMRDAPPGEPAIETFQRAEARLRADKPFQQPVVAGIEEARGAALLGGRGDRSDDRVVVAIGRVTPDGTVLLQGGWACGLSVGSTLRRAGVPGDPTTLTVTRILGLGQSEARLAGGGVLPATIQSGALLEMTGWATAPSRPMRVLLPRADRSLTGLTAFAGTLKAAAGARRIGWITDPLIATPTHLLRRGDGGWELLAGGRLVATFTSDEAAVAAVRHLPKTAALFVQFPAPASLADALVITTGTAGRAIERVERADDADYILVGRYADHHLAFAWVRPLAERGDRHPSAMPLRSDWLAQAGEARVTQLTQALLRLRRVQAWTMLESPRSGGASYHLALLRGDGSAAGAGPLVGGQSFRVQLRAPGGTTVPPRFVYVFAIDSYGKGALLFPQHGSVENRFPLQGPEPQTTIDLGVASRFQISPPYGFDTYVLLTTDDPLVDPWVLDWSGVRKTRSRPLPPLEELLLRTADLTRSPAVTLVTPSNWSLERLVVESVPPRGTKR